MSEEKKITSPEDEVIDVTLEEAAKEAEAPEVIKEAPVLKAEGAKAITTPNMIHKHEDNFLAKIAGETPQDEEIRNSTEFWLNEIAKNSGGGGESPHLYIHKILMVYDQIEVTIYDNSPELYTIDKLKSFLSANGYTFDNNKKFLVTLCTTPIVTSMPTWIGLTGFIMYDATNDFIKYTVTGVRQETSGTFTVITPAAYSNVAISSIRSETVIQVF